MQEDRGGACANTTPWYTQGLSTMGLCYLWGPWNQFLETLRDTGTARHPVHSNTESWAAKSP